MIKQTRIPPGIIPSTLLGRVAAALIATSVAVIGLFFLMFALIAATLLGTIVIARIWGLSRKLRAQRNADVIEGSYSVQVDSPPAVPSQDLDSSTPRRDRG